jgi:hypothetical protein
MATKSSNSKGSKKTSSKKSQRSHKAVTTADGQPTLQGAVAGNPNPGNPKVGDSNYRTAKEDRFSTGHDPTSDGTHAGQGAPKPASKKKTDSKKAKASGPGGQVKMGDMVAFITGGRVPGKVRPAVVIRTTDPEAVNADEGRIDVTVFPDAGKYPNNDHLGNIHFREGIRYSENLENDTWHFREDTNSLLDKKEKSEAQAVEDAQSQIDANRRKVGGG